MKQLTVIDLFSGAGGLSEGFSQTEKFIFLSHVEWESPMVETLRNNLIKRWNYSQEDAKKRVIQFDIQKTEELINGFRSGESTKKYVKNNHPSIVKDGLKGLIGKNNVDVIIGGPPCKAYSLAGRAQDPNSMKNDYRNYLFESFTKVVDHFQPKIFVFENVPGMLSAKPGDILVTERIYEAFNNIGYEIRKPNLMSNSVYSSSDFGVPQERKRVIIFGVKRDGNIQIEDLYKALDSSKSKESKKTVKDAIGYLPKFKPLEFPYKRGRNNVSHEPIDDISIPFHIPRYHNKRDIIVFFDWLSKKMNDFPHDKKIAYYKEVTGQDTNHNKYRNLEWEKPSPTIVAHLHKDGLMFIHPDINQLRSITIREAALLQSFPTDFEFLGSNADCFKMIGNAVPVLFAKAIANSLYMVMEKNNEKI